jgi:hypothetical protein
MCDPNALGACAMDGAGHAVAELVFCWRAGTTKAAFGLVDNGALSNLKRILRGSGDLDP